MKKICETGLIYLTVSDKIIAGKIAFKVKKCYRRKDFVLYFMLGKKCKQTTTTTTTTLPRVTSIWLYASFYARALNFAARSHSSLIPIKRIEMPPAKRFCHCPEIQPCSCHLSFHPIFSEVSLNSMNNPKAA